MYPALGVVRSSVAVRKGAGVRINCVSPGQIDVGVSLNEFDTPGMSSQSPPSGLRPYEIQESAIGIERPGMPQEVACAGGFLASGFSSYMAGTNLNVDG